MAESSAKCLALLAALFLVISTALPGCAGKTVPEQSGSDHIALAADPTDEGSLSSHPTPVPSAAGTPEMQTDDGTAVEKSPGTGASPDPEEKFKTTIGKTIDEQADKIKARDVDLVLCLDTSDSMGILIDSARKKLGDMARDIEGGSAKRRLRVALLAYGSPEYGPQNGWVRIETDFTEDMGLVHSKLSALKCHGGDEYVCRVIMTAMRDLQWNPSPETLRAIFAAGNESASQDPVNDMASVCIDAARRGIIINTIYCGPKEEHDAAEWEELAIRGGGRFTAMSLDECMLSEGSPVRSCTGLGYVPSGSPALPKPVNRGGMTAIQGILSGVVNDREILLKELSGQSSRTLTLSGATKYKPPSWRPSAGNYVNAYIDMARPGAVKELDFLK
jgi:hypothetical protein